MSLKHSVLDLVNYLVPYIHTTVLCVYMAVVCMVVSLYALRWYQLYALEVHS